MILFKDEERYAQWEANGRKGPAPRKYSESGPPEFAELPDVTEIPGIRIT